MSINKTMPLVHHESLVTITQLEVGKIVAQKIDTLFTTRRLDDRSSHPAQAMRPLPVHRGGVYNQWQLLRMTLFLDVT